MLILSRRCPSGLCGNQRARKDGTMARHQRREPPEQLVCSGTGRPAAVRVLEDGRDPIGVRACTRCQDAPALPHDDLCVDCQAEIAGVG